MTDTVATSPSRSDDRLECCGLLLTTTELLSVDRGRIMVRVKRSEVHGLILRYGLRSPRPYVQRVGGLALCALGLAPILHTLWILLNNGDQILGFELYASGFLIPGLWFVYDSFQKGFYLEALVRDSAFKLSFNAAPSRSELDRFLSQIENRWGQSIRKDVPHGES